MGPELESQAARLVERTKLALLADGGRMAGSPRPAADRPADSALQRSVEDLRSAVEGKASKWEMDSLRKELHARASKEEVGLALARKVDVSVFVAHVKSCAGAGTGQQ